MMQCIVCHSEFTHRSLHDIINGPSKLCPRCLAQMHLSIRKFRIDSTTCFSLYHYDGFLRHLLLQLKVQGDFALADIFFYPILWELRFQFFGYTIIPVPSFRKSDQIRGFNHIEAMVSSLHLPIVHAFRKSKNYKQSEQKEGTRGDIKKYIQWNLSSFSPRKHYLLVDDIITSQQTLKTCLSLMKKNGARRIKVLVVANNCRMMQK